MKLDYHKNFQKQYKKLAPKDKQKVRERLLLFEEDLFHLSLNNHTLHGRYKHFRSINISGDLRALYLEKNGVFIFVAIDTHSNLYS